MPAPALLQRLAARDPGLQSLRRAGRVGVVATGLLVLGVEVLDDPVLGLFAMFGAFSLLGFADFGGPPRSRGIAYVSLTAVGAGLIVIGSAVQDNTVAAVAGMVVIGFVVRFVGSFGGFWYASVSPAILAYVLAVTSPTADPMSTRVAGWCLAGAVSTIAALVLWPRASRSHLRDAAAGVATALADRIDLALPGRPAADGDAAVRARLVELDRAVQEPLRPSGPGMHDSALRLVVDDLRRIAGNLGPPPGRPEPDDPPIVDDVGAVASRALRAAAAELRGEAATETLGDLVDERERHLDALTDWAGGALRDPADAPKVLAAIDAAFPVRLVASLALSTLANSVGARSGAVPDDARVTADLRTPTSAGNRLWVATRLRLSPGSPAFQDALRSGIALGLAVLLASSLALDHAFWVALGTLSVLRSNAFATGDSAIRAALGTAIGFAATSALFAVVGPSEAVLWVLAAGGLFFAAYAPQIFGFVAGQVAFTVAVVAAFNLLEPNGWHTGLTRVEDILLGAGISLGVAFVFWPRREVRELRSALAATFSALGPALVAALEDFRTGATDPPRSVQAVLFDEGLARANYRVFVDETAARRDHQDPWGRYLALAGHIRSGIVFVPAARRRFPGVDHEAGFAALTRGAERIAVALDSAAGEIGDGSPAPDGTTADAVEHDVTPAVVDALAARAGGTDVTPALGLAWARDWLLLTAALTDEVFSAGR